MPGQISFATFNLKNLQLPGQPTYPNSTPYTQAEYDAKVVWIARNLEEVDADIIGFQELWDPQCLADVFTAAGVDNQYDLITRDQTGRINNACAVWAPHQRTYSTFIEDFPDDFALVKRGGAVAEIPEYQIRVNIDNFSRPVLRVTVQPVLDNAQNLPAIAVFVAHLKSKRPMDVDQ